MRTHLTQARRFEGLKQMKDFKFLRVYFFSQKWWKTNINSCRLFIDKDCIQLSILLKFSLFIKFVYVFSNRTTSEQPPQTSLIWNILQEHNPFFVSREDHCQVRLTIFILLHPKICSMHLRQVYKAIQTTLPLAWISFPSPCLCPRFKV